MDEVYQVFVSSTFTDLEEERRKVSDTLSKASFIPAGMELFPATSLQQLEFIKRVIDRCDYYVVIVGARYGSLDGEKSFTEREYEYAVSKHSEFELRLYAGTNPHDPTRAQYKLKSTTSWSEIFVLIIDLILKEHDGVIYCKRDSRASGQETQYRHPNWSAGSNVPIFDLTPRPAWMSSRSVLRKA